MPARICPLSVTLSHFSVIAMLANGEQRRVPSVLLLCGSAVLFGWTTTDLRPNNDTEHRSGSCAESCVTAASPKPEPSVDRPSSEDQGRIRSDSLAVKEFIQEGDRLSWTFHSIVTKIDATNGLVYISEGDCPDAIKACLFLGIQQAGPNRLLRVRVEIGRRKSEDVIGSIGHELQHVLEALSDTRVISGADMLGVWLHGVHFGKQRFETNAAIEMGNRIRTELHDLRRKH